MIVGAPQQSSSVEPQAVVLHRAHDETNNTNRLPVVSTNLPGEFARKPTLVPSCAKYHFVKELPPARSSSIRQRVAHAKYESVRNPVTLIPEQRIVDVWNQYVKEIGAPDEAIVSVAEIHNMRDGSFTFAQLMWARGNQTIWTMPNGYAHGSDGKVAEGCRALEAIRVMHDLEDLFQNLRGARDRLRRGIVPSEEIKKRVGEPNPQPHGSVRLEARADTNPTRPAEQRYVQEHGTVAYDQLLARLFDELFPAQ